MRIRPQVDESELRKPKGRQMEQFEVDGVPLEVNTAAAAAAGGGGGGAAAGGGARSRRGSTKA